jgi:type I restriction enzyme S subunit
MSELLADVVSQVVDCEHKTSPTASPGNEYAFSIGTRDLRDGRIHLRGAKLVDHRTYQLWTQRAVPVGGDLILAREAPVGEVGYVDGRHRLCLGQRTVLIRPHVDKVDSRFLHYRLLSPRVRQWMDDRSAGSTVAHLNVADIRQMPVGPLPPLTEQCAIAEVLGALDDKIEANRCAVLKAEGLAIAIAGGIERRTAVREFASQSRRLVPTTFFADQEVEYFSLPAFDAGRMALVQDGERIKSGKFLLERPTVLVSKLNPHIPRVWMTAPTGRVPAITSTEFVGLVPTANYPVEVLWALCASAEFTAQLAEMAKGTTGSHQRVSTEDMLALEIPDPRALAAGATETITAAVQLARRLWEESERLAALRGILLPGLMSGELQVRDTDEPVEEAV